MKTAIFIKFDILKVFVIFILLLLIRLFFSFTFLRMRNPFDQNVVLK